MNLLHNPSYLTAYASKIYFLFSWLVILDWSYFGCDSVEQGSTVLISASVYYSVIPIPRFHYLTKCSESPHSDYVLFARYCALIMACTSS
jgi:hypothetical protein